MTNKTHSLFTGFPLLRNDPSLYRSQSLLYRLISIQRSLPFTTERNLISSIIVVVLQPTPKSLFRTMKRYGNGVRQALNALLVFCALCVMILGQAARSEGACDNDGDKAAWASKKSLMSSDLDTCGRQCWGESSCVSSCMGRLDGYSKPCADCFGTLVSCTKTNCMSKCMLGKSESCVECTKTNCTPKFSSCSVSCGQVMMSCSCSSVITGRKHAR